jgi:hypothetical protein
MEIAKAGSRVWTLDKQTVVLWESMLARHMVEKWAASMVEKLVHAKVKRLVD